MSVASEKRNCPWCLAAHTGRDSIQNLGTSIPHPLAFSSGNGARAEVFRLALAALSPDELVEWLSGFGCGGPSLKEAA